MSSFVCSAKHFKELKRLSYKFILSDKYTLLDFNMSYNTDNGEIKDFIISNICHLCKLNVASVNYQYNCNEKVNFKDYIGFDIPEPNSNLMSMEELIGLYNGYDCLKYQIELKFDTTFIDILQKHIAKEIIRRTSDNYELANKWEFKEVI